MNTMKLVFILILASAVFCDQSQTDTEEDVFDPEDDWKIIKPGQTVPRGTHVRIDLSTGERQGKKISESESKEETPKDQELVSTQFKEEDEDKLVEESRERLRIAFEKLQGDDPPEPEEQESAERPRFRSYEELKKLLGESNMEIQTDAEQLNSLLTSWQNVGDSEASQLALLHSFEDIVHKYDSAVTFVQMDGFKRVLIPALGNSSTPAIRGAALRTLAACAQSNPYVQTAALEAGLVAQTLQLLRTEPLPGLKAALYALGCLVRGQSVSRRVAFGDDSDSGGGLAILADLYKRAPSLRVSVRALISDLTIEDVSFGERLRQANWCQRLIEDTTSIHNADSVFEAIHALESICRDYFKSNEAQKALLQWHLALFDAQDEENAEAVYKLIQRLRPREEL